MKRPGGLVDFTFDAPTKCKLKTVVKWAKDNHCWFKRGGLGRALFRFVRNYGTQGVGNVVHIYPDFCDKSFLLNVFAIKYSEIANACTIEKIITIGLIFDESNNTWSSHS